MKKRKKKKKKRSEDIEERLESWSDETYQNKPIEQISDAAILIDMR